ncbi:MAG: Eco57I restriction-modification methylase domain-containing protein, partial [Elusimicrobiota bacterium]
MNSKELLKQTIEKPFDRQKFRQLIAYFLNEYRQKQVSLNSFYKSHSEHFNQLNLLGEYQDANGKKIHILEVELKNAHKLEYARTAQRNLISKYLKDNWLDGALVGFWTPDCSHWRFSFVELAWEFDKESKKTKKVLSPAKRYSFLIGEDEPSHTAQFQILPVLEQEKKTILEDVEKAFSVEQVTKEFYQEYRKLFDKLCKELNQNRVFQMIKETKRIDTTNFAKKLLGQIVFLYFIQKKGWLGVPINKKWGEGDRDFLTHVFEKAKGEKRNFFNDYLEVLFYNTLNNPRREEVDPSYSKLLHCRIPFLNGGLFEPMKGYDWENSLLLLNNDLFSNTADTGILDVFNRYNFTVKEDEPLEKEVAVDPEMLGKVFENLLEENLRKGKGAYYTPREIVHYMCQESLINYLITESKIDEKKIRNLVTRDMVLTKEDIKEAMRNEKTKKRLSNRVLTFWEEEAKRLEEILKDIKVVDPACGSGAFLVGMLQEIVKARQVLQLFTDKEFNEYKLKKETIQSCIYGVDIDPGAIEIAKLRLWLSLVVDYELEEIEPLPNLDYKVMQGNSLLEELVLGDTAIKLFDPNLVINEKKKMKNLFEEEKQEDLFEGRSPVKKVMKKLDKLRKKYFRISDLSEKLQVKKQIEYIEQNLVKECIDKEIKKLDIQRKNIGKYIVPGIGMTKKDAKRLAKTLSAQATIMEMWQEFRESGVRPFFLWHLYFADVFEQKGGFDIVIANPPYVRQEEIKDQKPILRKQGYKVYNNISDLYTYFYERSYDILRNNGILAFISSNKWMRAKYGEKLRNFFQEKTKVLHLIDFSGHKVFQATVDTNIILFQKTKPDKTHKINFVNVKGNLNGKDLVFYLEENQGVILQNRLDDKCWTLADESILKLKEKIGKIGAPLRDWNVKIYRGVLTGFNEAFIIDTVTKEKLCKEDSKSAEVLKPLLRGRDIRRYYYQWQGLW